MDWKKLGYAALAAVLSYLLLGLVSAILSVKIFIGIAALAIGVLVYTKVAQWEIQQVLDAAKKRIGG